MAKRKRSKCSVPAPISKDNRQVVKLQRVKRRGGHLWTKFRPHRDSKQGKKGYRRHAKHRSREVSNV